MIAPAIARQIRESLKLSTPRMADIVGVHPRTWIRYEQGDSVVPLTVERILAIVLRYPQVRQDLGLGV